MRAPSLRYQPVQRPPANGRNPAPASADNSRRKDPYLGLRFWIQLENVNVAGFKECSPLTIETETFEYQEGGLNTYTHKMPVRTKYTNITLKRGVDEGQDLHRWYMQAVNGQARRQNISIQVFDSLGHEVKKWDLQNAYPTKWTGPDLKAEAGSIFVETLEIAHEGLIPSSS